MAIAVALTIAGSDPSGGAGIQADLKTFHQCGAYGEAVITLLTVQNTRAVRRVEVMPPDLVAEQIAAVLEDVPPHAMKTGALGSAAVIAAVADSVRGHATPLVVDPVMVSKHGAALLEPDAQELFRRLLLPQAFLVTPNLPEAEVLTGRSVRNRAEMADAAKAIRDLGATAVLVKGGHLTGGQALDLLLIGQEQYEFTADRIDTPHTHGTGCTYSAAITAHLARGQLLPSAVDCAKRFIDDAIRTNPRLGHGHGPVNHFARASGYDSP